MTWDRILIFAMASFIALMIFFYVGFMSSRQPLVVERPYEAGLQHNSRLEAQKNAELSRRTLFAQFDQATNRLVLRFAAINPRAANGQIKLFRPSDDRFDREYKLNINDSLIQYLPAQDLIPGRWLVQASWNEGDSAFFTQTSFYR